MMTATAEVVNLPAANFADLSLDVDALVALQQQASEIEKQARVLRAQVKEAMISRGLDSFQSAGGHKASLFDVTRTEVDRETAMNILAPQLIALLFKPVTTTQLRVK